MPDLHENLPNSSYSKLFLFGQIRIWIVLPCRELVIVPTVFMRMYLSLLPESEMAHLALFPSPLLSDGPPAAVSVSDALPNSDSTA